MNIKQDWHLLKLISLIVLPWQFGFAANSSALSLVLHAGNNIPVSYTGDGDTISLNFIQIQVSAEATCAGATNWMQASAAFPGGFSVVGQSTIYLNTSPDWTYSRSIAKGLCPSSTTSQYMKISQVWNQDGIHCNVHANCFKMSCAATGTVSGGLTGILPTVECNSAI